MILIIMKSILAVPVIVILLGALQPCDATLGYPKETEPIGRFERIPIDNLIHYEKW
jgi:hypothetical protein